MQQLSTLNTTEPIDYDNLNIVIHPRPPRRRQSGISLVPFRPYVKCLTSVRQPFSFADGHSEWIKTGKKETFFKQENARCIGSLIDDCDISDVIRWDIEGESTRLPMMCKLWMIVDGAVVERGKPHLVQDAAIQVFTAGRNYRSILAAEQRYNPSLKTTFNRRRRHSWHDVNEYHSVPYYQYSRSVRSGYQDGIQCDLDNEHVTSTQEYLPFVVEETVDENQLSHLEEHIANETVHNQSIPQDRVHISIMTQTEHLFNDQSTSIDTEFIQLFNLNIQTNENLLSSTANPYNNKIYSSDNTNETTTKNIIRNDIEYKNVSISTGDDYPQWWIQLSTNIILSDHITNQGEENKSSIILQSPRQLDQSIQTDTEHDLDNDFDKPRPTSSSTRSSRIQKSSSSITINDNYEIIDQINDGNNSRRLFPFNNEQQQQQQQRQRIDSDSHLSDYQIENLSNRRLRRITTSSKQSDSDYHTFESALNQQSYSTPEPYNNNIQTTTSSYSSINETNQRKRTKSSESTSTSVLATLLERYERTLKERQKAATIVNDQLLNIDDVLKRYKDKVQNTDRDLQFYQNNSILVNKSKEENASLSSSSAPLSLVRLTQNKYRTMPEITSEQMLQGYIPSPRLYITNTIIDSSQQRQPRFDYCDLCLHDHDNNSAWIRYNEQRIDQLQKRIDLMLQIDDYEENQFLLFNDTVTQRIDDLLMKKPKRRNQISSYHNRILLPHRYNFRYPYRLNQSSFPSTPRLLTRNLIRTTNSLPKSVRISTDPEQIRLREPIKSMPRPIVSILRRTNTNFSPRSKPLVEPTHIWKNESDGKIYILKQFSIPRYYRLYNDVSFREIYHFSRILDTYLKQTDSSQIYSTILKNFAVQQQLPTITSFA